MTGSTSKRSSSSPSGSKERGPAPFDPAADFPAAAAADFAAAGFATDFSLSHSAILSTSAVKRDSWDDRRLRLQVSHNKEHRLCL